MPTQGHFMHSDRRIFARVMVVLEKVPWLSPGTCKTAHAGPEGIPEPSCAGREQREPRPLATDCLSTWKSSRSGHRCI